MRSTEHKITTLRSASARATLRMNQEALAMLREGKTPKGDALEVARVAGVMAAKRTADVIPFCHPLPLDHVAVTYELHEAEVTITSSVTAIWKTGVEMEAMVAAQMAATTIFDMLKMVDPGMIITDVHVVHKAGGKSDYRESIPAGFRAAVIVTSDGTASGKREDRSGRIIRERLEAFGIAGVEYVIVPDEIDVIEREILRFHESGFHLVLTTGGTGLGPRDVTAQVTRRLIEREIPGIAEAARSFGQQRTPYAMLSTGLAGLRGNMLIVNLPGSSRGAGEALDAIFPAVLHGYKMMRGGGH